MSYEDMLRTKAQHGYKNMTKAEKEEAEKEISERWEKMKPLFKKNSNFKRFRELEIQEISLKKFKTLTLDARYDYERRRK